ncbi:MAG: branched-chain amino acid ABC transporter permease [Streptosporangiaceae bacterium]
MSAFLQYLISGIAIGCTFALVASGFVAIFRVTGVINFAQGTFAVLGGFVAYSVLHDGLPHGVAEIVALLAAAGAGLVVGMVAIGRHGRPPLASLIITLGLGIFAYAVEIVAWGDQPISFRGIPGTFVFAGAHIRKQYLLVILVTLLVFGLLGVFFSRTYIGKGLVACSSNPFAARLMGINVTRMGFMAFALGGLLGGLAGVLITPLQPNTFNSDVALATNGFAAAIFGGLTRSSMALVGGLVLGIAESMIGGYYRASYQTEIALALMLALMIWQARHRVEVA